MVSFKVPDKVNNILSLYKKSKTENIFIFPYLEKSHTISPLILQKKVRNANYIINKYLKRLASDCKIKKNLTMHISRHTFGNIASDKVSPQALQKLYRHSDLKTTIGYQANFIHKDVDDALEKVINFGEKWPIESRDTLYKAEIWTCLNLSTLQLIPEGAIKEMFRSSTYSSVIFAITIFIS